MISYSASARIRDVQKKLVEIQDALAEMRMELKSIIEEED